jgi:uncharacterized membrane protein YkvA (DUF1232 family)
MTELDDRCLDAFPEWLRALGSDARALAEIVNDDRLGDAVRRPLASALNYLFKSLDLIPDGIEDLGFIDDAFVLRVAAQNAVAAEASAAKLGDGALGRLAEQATLVAEFLAGDFARLQRYVSGLDAAPVRGRAVSDILSDASVRSELVGDVRSWSESYRPPSFARDDKNLVKLRAFLSAKLPKD